MERRPQRLILNRLELRHVEGGHAGCLGAAMLAGIGSGTFKDASDAVTRGTLETELIQPSGSTVLAMKRHFHRFRELAEHTLGLEG